MKKMFSEYIGGQLFTLSIHQFGSDVPGRIACEIDGEPVPQYAYECRLKKIIRQSPELAAELAVHSAPSFFFGGVNLSTAWLREDV